MRLPHALSGLTCVCLAFALTAAPSSAQTTSTASLKGRVLDGDGEGLPGVVLELTNPGVALGAKSLVTDIEGNYQFKLLPPGGGYTLKASIPGFATVIAGPFELHSGRTTTQDLTLKPSAELEETIMVEARGNIVDTTTTKTSTIFNAEFIEGIPLVGRQFTDLLALAPGVTDSSGDGRFNVRGARDTGLQLRLDGTNVSDPLTGYFGQEINLDAIEEIEVITSGASAEYGRADGGFANVITKSGGNDTSGSARLFFRSDFLDGGGAGNNDLNRGALDAPPFTDLELALTLGGAVVKDRLWYFTSAERLDHEMPIIFAAGGSALQTATGWRAFGKVTWQANADNKLALQINYDPIEHLGNFVGPHISPESDVIIRTGGPLPQLKWTSVLSPQLLLEAVASQLTSGVAFEPASSRFEPIAIETFTNDQGVLFAKLPCRAVNCTGEDRFFKLNFDGTRTGPFPFRGDDNRDRTTFRADLSYSIEDLLGSHALKTGFELNDEQYRDRPIFNPQIVDDTSDSQDGIAPRTEPVPSFIRYGDIHLEFFQPSRNLLAAEGFVFGGYLQETWRPRPNLTINAGVRYDHEEIDTIGVTPFDPLPEAREMLRRFTLLCELSGDCPHRATPGRIELRYVESPLRPPPGHPLLEFDGDGDGIIEVHGADAGLVTEHLTRIEDIRRTGVRIANGNLAPRLSVSWDPRADGRTKLFGTWSRYYDRLLLGHMVREQEPRSFTARWITNGPGFQADPGEPSEPVSFSTGVQQLDHDLKTPSTLEWTLGVERELAPEWAVSLTFIRRRFLDQLQDLDVNHFICTQFDTVFGVDPMAVCGDGGQLEEDQFGDLDIKPPPENSDAPPTVTSRPNGAVDRYVLNPNFNQVLRLGNFNEARYTAGELTLRKRLHRNWQMQLSYTRSRATGDAEGATDLNGNDPGTSDKVAGFLDYDQQHQLRWTAVAHLPHEIVLGGSVEWSSGFPYSVLATISSDHDDAGIPVLERIAFPTGRKNDQRNPGYWQISGRVEKRLIAGQAHLTAFLSGENLIDDDYLRIRSVDTGDFTGLTGTRNFGRRWELGVSVQF